MTIYSSSDDTRASFDQAMADARDGKRDDAVRQLRQIVSDDPAHVEAWIWLGGTAPTVDERRQALERALELEPDNARAQQGIDWLRATAPQTIEPSADQAVLDTSVSSPMSDPDQAEHVARAEQPTQVVEQSAIFGPAGEQRYEQVTQTIPVAHGTSGPDQYEPGAQSRPAPPLGRTEAMVQPAHARPRRAIGANIARWAFLIPVWGLGLGAMLVTAGFVVFTLLFDPPLLDRLAASAARPLGYQLDLGQTGRIAVLVGLVGLVVISTLALLGMLIGRTWAWALALMVTLLAFGAAIALAAIPFVLGNTTSIVLTDPLTQLSLGILGFTFGMLLLTIVSRRAFRGADAERYER